MDMKVIEGGFGKKPCSDLAALLRSLADAVERGEVVDLIAAYTDSGEYQMVYSASLTDSIVLATLLQKRALDRMVVS